MIAIVDYGVGNLFSLVSSFNAIGADVVVTDDADKIRSADKIVLPGVGAFADAKEKLIKSGLEDVVVSEARKGKPILGICLGMQLLFEKSYEYGEHSGLGLLKGEIVPILGRITSGLKIPHIGWNALKFKKESPLFKYIKDGDFVYFVHSFKATLSDRKNLLAHTFYGEEIPAVIGNGKNVFGCQFHPEKSERIGLSMLEGFINFAKNR